MDLSAGLGYGFCTSDSALRAAPSSQNGHPATPPRLCRETPFRTELKSDEPSPSDASDWTLSLQEGARLLVELRNSLLRQETSSTDDEQEESAAGTAASEQGSTEKLDRLADSNLTSPLLKVLHRMLCYESGKGLIVSELGAKLVEKCNQQDLQGELIPRSVKLARIMRSCPYFAELEGHGFTLWSKILAQPQPVPDQHTRSAAKIQEQAKSAACAKVGGMKCLDLGSLNKKQEKNADESYQKKKKLEVGLVGDGGWIQCKRGDGKGWQCREMARPGYCWCDYHLLKHRQNHVLAKMRKTKTKTKVLAQVSSAKLGPLSMVVNSTLCPRPSGLQN